MIENASRIILAEAEGENRSLLLIDLSRSSLFCEALIMNDIVCCAAKIVIFVASTKAYGVVPSPTSNTILFLFSLKRTVADDCINSPVCKQGSERYFLAVC
jgi:hypothetical protein